MRVYAEIAQQTSDWFAIRRGKVTASGLKRIVTSAKLQPSSQAKSYMNELAAEILIGEDCVSDASSGWAARGTEMESQALSAYELLKDVDVLEVGFVERDDGWVGCSPDGLVGSDGMLELKVPSAANHVGYHTDPDSLVAAYRLQVQGQLWVAGRDWCDLFSYSPELPPVIVRCIPEPAVFEAFEKHVNAFVERLKLHVEQLGGVPDVRMTEREMDERGIPR